MRSRYASLIPFAALCGCAVVNTAPPPAEVARLRDVRDACLMRNAITLDDGRSDAAAIGRAVVAACGRENAAGRVRVDEGDLEPEEAAAGLLVDQLGAAGGEPGELVGDVVDLERNVVHAGPALGEELPDRRIGAERRE